VGVASELRQDLSRFWELPDPTIRSVDTYVKFKGHMS
jgi:hypothetical protein